MQDLGYSPKLRYIKEANQVITSDGQQTQVDQLPADLQDLLSLPGVEVLDKIGATLQQADAVLAKISANLANDVANGVTFQDYINARTKGDVEKIVAYESAHAGISGKTAAEAVPIVLDAKSELDALQHFTNDRLFQGLADPKDLAETKERELKHIDNLVVSHLNGQELPLNDLRMDHHFKDVVSSRTQTISHLLQSASEVLSATIEMDAGGQLPTLVQSALDVSSHLDTLQALNQLHFETTAEDFDNARMKTFRLTPLSIRLRVIQELDAVQRTLMQYQGALQMLKGFDSRGGQHPAATLMTNASSGLQKLYERYDMLLEDARKFNVLLESHNGGMMDGLDGKRNARAIDGFLHLLANNLNHSTHSEALVGNLVRMIKQNS